VGRFGGVGFGLAMGLVSLGGIKGYIVPYGAIGSCPSAV